MTNVSVEQYNNIYYTLLAHTSYRILKINAFERVSDRTNWKISFFTR